jgi:hypothetical protein
MLKIFRYKRDYYINDSTDSLKRLSGSSAASKSASFDDDVSDENFTNKLFDQHSDKDFLMEKLLNSKFDERSVSSLNSRESPESDVSIPIEIVRQLESQMLHSDLKRESFRARSGTKNFCLNPLFEEGFVNQSNEIEIKLENINKKAQELPSTTTNSLSSLDEIKANCVENIFMDLNKVRRSGSVKSADSDRPNFVSERCHSLKRVERNLK